MGGGIIGNEMGLGKTFQMIAHCVTEANFALARKEVEREWKVGKPSLHLARHTENSPQAKDARCPSGIRFGMRCPCERWGPTHNWQAHLGATLIFVPASLVLTFSNEWRKFIDRKASPHMELHVELGDNHISNDIDDILLQKVSHKKENLPDGSQDVEWYLNDGKVEHAHHVLLTSNLTWQSRLENRWSVEDKVTVLNSRGKSVVRTCTYYKISVARFILDEIHTTKGKDTIAMRLMAKLADAARWGYSGTAIEGQPKRAIGAFLDALGMPSWDKHQALMYARGQRWDRLNKLYNLCTNPSRLDKLSTEEFNKDFQELLTGMGTLWPVLMLKLSMDTPWGRTEIIPDLPSITHRDIPVNLPEDVARSINKRQSGIFRKLAEKMEWKKGQPAGSPILLTMFFQYCMPVRVLTSYPALNQLVEQGAIPGFMSSNIEKGKWTNWQTIKESPLYQHRNLLRDGSPKYKALIEFHRKDLMGPASPTYPEPHLVMSCSPMVALVTWMVVTLPSSLSLSPSFFFFWYLFRVLLTSSAASEGRISRNRRADRTRPCRP